jgi:3-oxoacyl-[acyl-carrier protein] reductase
MNDRNRDHKLAGKVALVTGGARGLGRGYALRLAGLGADIAIIDRNLKGAEVYEFEKKAMTAATVMAECEALGVRSIGLEVDLTNRAAAFKAIDDVVARMGGLDIVVCNAGGGTIVFADEQDGRPDFKRGANDTRDHMTTGTPSDTSDEMINRVMDINVRTTQYTCMAAAQHMKSKKAGKIVTVASVAGVDARPGYHPYGMAKAAIIHYTRSLAQELGPFGINVNCIAPGLIRTGRLGEHPGREHQVALRRIGTVDDCAKVVEFLATDLSDYVTGRTILIDGGYIK